MFSSTTAAYLRYLQSQGDDMILRNVAGQKLTVIAINVTTNLVVSGDAANITATISLDGGAPAASNDVNPTELGTTGQYQFDLTQAETDGALFVVAPVSSTSNVIVIALPSNAIYTVAQVPDVNMLQISGDASAADNLEAMFDGTGYTNANAPAIQSQIGTPSDLGSGADVASNLSDMAGATFDNSTDSLEAIRNQGDAAWTSANERFVLQDTTIATLTDQLNFTLTAGSADDDVYNTCIAIIQDQTTAEQKAVVIIEDYDGATKGVVLRAAPGFTIAVGDNIFIIAYIGNVEVWSNAVIAQFQNTMSVQGYTVPRALALDNLDKGIIEAETEIILAMTQPDTLP